MILFDTPNDFRYCYPNGIVPTKDICYIKSTKTLIYRECDNNDNIQWYWGGSFDNTDPETPVTPPSRPDEETPIDTPDTEIQWKWSKKWYDTVLPYRVESGGQITYRERRVYYYWYSYNGKDWFKSDVQAYTDSIDRTIKHDEPDETFIMEGKLHRVWYYWYADGTKEVRTDEVWKSDDIDISDDTEPTEDVVEISEVYNLPADEFGYYRVRYFIVNGVLTDKVYARAYKRYAISTNTEPDKKTAAKGGYNEVYYNYATHEDGSIVKTSQIGKVVFVDTTATKEYRVDAVNGYYTYTRTYYTNYRGVVVVLNESERVFHSNVHIDTTAKSATWFSTYGSPNTETSIPTLHDISGTFTKSNETDAYVEYTSSTTDPWSFAEFKCVGFDVLKWAIKAGNGKYISANSYLTQVSQNATFDENGLIHNQNSTIKTNGSSFVSVSHNTKVTNAYYIRVGCNCKGAVIRIYKKP